MLTIRQFGEMADSYGSDLRRWPEEVRAEASLLVEGSAEARRILEDARRLDRVIEAGAEVYDAAEQGAALARLRSMTAARIPAIRDREPFAEWQNRAFVFWQELQTVIVLRRGWIGMAAGGSVAVAMGLMVGLSYAPASTADNFQAMLQPAPINIMAE